MGWWVYVCFMSGQGIWYMHNSGDVFFEIEMAWFYVTSCVDATYMYA